MSGTTPAVRENMVQATLGADVDIPPKGEHIPAETVDIQMGIQIKASEGFKSENENGHNLVGGNDAWLEQQFEKMDATLGKFLEEHAEATPVTP